MIYQVSIQCGKEWRMICETNDIEEGRRRRDFARGMGWTARCVDTRESQIIKHDKYGRGIGPDCCAYNHGCCAKTYKVLVFDNNGAECRWPVCDKHAKPFLFRYLGNVSIEDKYDVDGNSTANGR